MKTLHYVGGLALQAKFILLSMSAWFLISFMIGHMSARDALTILKTEISAEDQPKWLEPLLHPSVIHRRNEIENPMLLELTLRLFAHNTIALGIVIYTGSLLFFIPFVSVFVQGWICGAILQLGGYRALLHRIIPHAFVEIPILISGASIGTLLAFRFYRTMTTNVRHSFLVLLKDASLTYIVCVPFLLLSAVLEGYGTKILWAS